MKHLKWTALLLTLVFSFSALSNEVKKVKDDRAMVVFSTIDLKKGDLVEVTDVAGKVTGTGKVTALKGNKAIVKLTSGEDDVRPGDKVRLPPAPFETTDGDGTNSEEDDTPAYRRSSKSFTDRGFYVGAHLGYAMPQFKGGENAVSYGGQLGYRVNEKLDLSLNFTTFTMYTNLRMMLPFVRAAYAPIDEVPSWFFGAGAGASMLSIAGYSSTDFGVKVFSFYEFNFSPTVSLSPEVSWTYLFPVDQNTLTGYSLLELAARVRFYF